jgi:hypothetical protein
MTRSAVVQRLLGGAVLLLSLLSCGDGRYRGHVLFGAELTVFQPCGSQEEWTITEFGPGTFEEIYRWLDDGRNPPCNAQGTPHYEDCSVYVDVAGALEGPVDHGPYATSYAHSFALDKLYSAAPFQPSDCRSK